MSRPRWILATLLVATADAAIAAPPPPACDARYDVQQGGAPLGALGGALPTRITIAGLDLDIEGWCRVRARAAKGRKASMRLRAKLRNCGPVRRGTLDANLGDNCHWLNAVVKRRGQRRKTYFSASRYIAPSTFHTIEGRIFADRGCAVSSCHGVAQQGALDLRPGAAYASLVDVAPDNDAAAARGLLRVRAGDVAGSFLAAKLRGALQAGEGDPMPRVGEPLPAMELALVDAWIAAGAPETGHVEGAPELPPRVYEETPPLPPPPGGFQLVLDGPVLQPGQEEEGCLWVAAPTPVDVPIARIEIALNPGTHHFVIWQHGGGAPPPLGTWQFGNVACLGSGGNFGAQIAGAPHAPYYEVVQRPGFATVLPGGGYYGLNAHYYNESGAPIAMKAWVNFHPYEGTPERLIRTLPFDLSASGKIHVPPETQATTRGRLTNGSARTMRVTSLGGHMHKRGVRFSIWTSDGTKVLDDYDWAHPAVARFDPPRALAPGDWIDFECLHDNGVTRPLRRDGIGNPLTIVFGTSAEDEMCILTGQYYEE